MTIALILDPYGEKRPSGLGRAALALATAAIAAAPEVRFVVVLKQATQNKPHFSGNNWEVRAASGGRWWLDEAVRLSAEADVHVFFTPVYPLVARPRKSIVFVHDFAYRVFPNGFWRDTLLAWIQRRALTRADKVVAVSYATRAEAAAFSGRPEKDIAVVYNGINEFCPAGTPQSNTAVQNFFLLGGGIKQRKNTIPAIEGYAAYVQAGGDATLCILGEPRDAYGAEVRSCVEQLGLTDRVHFLGFCTDKDLAGYYAKTIAFIFPSAVEGFGMMPFEALSCGAPVVYAGTPVLREVLGDGGLAVDPHNAAEFGKALATLAGDPVLRAAVLERGRERLARYSWQKAGAELVGIAQSV